MKPSPLFQPARLFQQGSILLALLLWQGLFQASLAMAETSPGEKLQFGALKMTGFPIEGGFLKGVAPVGTKIIFDGIPVRLSRAGDFIIGFNRDEKASLPLKITYPQKPVEDYKIQIKKRSYNIQRIDGLPPAYVEPPAEVYARIKKETAQIVKARQFDSQLEGFSGSWVWPVKGVITGVYGSQRVYNGTPKRPHFGVDIAAPAGTKIKAPASGIIRLAHPDMYYSGGTIILDHGHGLFSAFLHMQKLNVSEGQKVRQGDILGEVGSGGRSTGAHLDWRMNWFRKRIDVAFFVPAMNSANSADSALP